MYQVDNRILMDVAIQNKVKHCSSIILAHNYYAISSVHLIYGLHTITYCLALLKHTCFVISSRSLSCNLYAITDLALLQYTSKRIYGLPFAFQL